MRRTSTRADVRYVNGSLLLLAPKDTSLRGNTSFEPQSVKLGPAVRPGRRIEKKDRTGQIVKKVTKVLYFT